jgi:hypothetical protein
MYLLVIIHVNIQSTLYKVDNIVAMAMVMVVYGHVGLDLHVAILLCSFMCIPHMYLDVILLILLEYKKPKEFSHNSICQLAFNS